MMDCDCEFRIARALAQGKGERVLHYYSEWLEAQIKGSLSENGPFSGNGSLFEEESSLFELEETFSEMRWQACLYQNRLGSRWLSQDGEAVEILNFGRWNHEEGPDFVGACVQFENHTPVQGDLELDRDVRDWERHRHARNPAYRNVLVHFFFKKPVKQRAFTRNIDGRYIRQVLLDPAQLQGSSDFIPQAHRPLFSKLDSTEVVRLIETAARFRMLRKRDEFRRKVRLFGFSQALFQAIATALGYRPNSFPFHLLAHRVDAKTSGSPQGEALLFGVAGFLCGEDFMKVSQDARKYLRGLWDCWWYYRDRFAHKQLPPGFWKRSSVRPLNYPERRLGTLAVIASRLSLLQKAVQSCQEDAFLELLSSLEHSFWQARCTFFTEFQAPPRKCLLLGTERALDLLVNVFYPAQNMADLSVWSRLQSIRLPVVPRRILEAASALVGWVRLPRAHLKEAAFQQGVLQMISHLERFYLEHYEYK